MQQFTCNGTGAQSCNLVKDNIGGPTTTTGAPPPPGQPDFGPNVFVFDPSMSSSAIQNQLNTIFDEQASNQFGTNRFAVLFKPVTYNNDVNIGFYTQALGLGLNPDDVDINGQVHMQADWNGNGGRTYFYQSEMPYDPPNQAAWMNGGTRGFASYKVSNNVTSHQAFGLGIYCFFEANPGNVADHAIETPTGSGIGFHHMVTVSLGGTGTIEHIINNDGGTVHSGNTVTDLNSGS